MGQAVISPTSLLYGSFPPPQAVAAAFARALACASRFEGATAPNPPVGCVLLDVYGNILAAAAHEKAGQPHAEALAIEQCRQGSGAGIESIHTVVVTLEPCNHTGRTPPCTEAILKTPAKAVWIGARDPNPAVRGDGAERLAAAGLAVDFIENLAAPEAARLAKAAARLIAPFAKRVRTGLPWVTVKQAVNQAGGMIPPLGQKTFTSTDSLIFAHQLRKRADAVLTGSGTILADAPEFTVRMVPDFPDKRRYLAIIDRRGQTPAAYLAAAKARGFETRVATSLPEALTQLGHAGALEVLVEAGPTLLAAVLDSDLWDEHIIIRQDASGEEHILIRRREAATPLLAGE